MSTETDQAAARKAQDLYRLDGSDPDTILALRSAFRAGAEFATEHTPSVVPDAAVEIGCMCGVVISVARYALGLAHNCPECGRPLITRFTIPPKETIPDA